MTAAIRYIRTPVLDIPYEESGSENGAPVILLHGWPYAPRIVTELCRRWWPPGCEAPQAVTDALLELIGNASP